MNIGTILSKSFIINHVKKKKILSSGFKQYDSLISTRIVYNTVGLFSGNDRWVARRTGEANCGIQTVSQK